MVDVDKDWISKQLGKIISAEESVIKAEKDHRDSIKVANIPDLYDRLIRDDQEHLNTLKQIASRYGWEEGGGVMETMGTIAGGAKSAVEGLTATDPFQAVANDVNMKSVAINSGRAWTRIFRHIGDEGSAMLMEKATADDESHYRLMMDACVEIGMMDARGQKAQAA